MLNVHIQQTLSDAAVSCIVQQIATSWMESRAHPYGVHYCSKHFEHIFDFLTPFSRPGGQILLSGITS